ncbi:o-succinylbenzoate synthase [Jatrophihabitans sp. YIM 134969]
MRHVIVSIPMRTKFRGITVRETTLIHGHVGWGEFGPFVEYGAAESRGWWRAAMEAATVGFPDPVRDRVPVNVTVPACDAETAAARVSASGCTTAKVKVAERGQDEREDLARLEAVRSALGPDGRVRIDVNAGWDVDTALTRLPRYARAAGGLEYVEQPCESIEDLAKVRRKQDVPVAADESIRRGEDPMLVVRREAADVVVLKVAPLGGVRRCLELAEAVGVPVVVSSALDTSVGIAAGVALAAALPELPYACGLGTVSLLADDVAADPYLPVDGHLPVRTVAPAEDALTRLAAAPERHAWWERRLVEVTGDANFESDFSRAAGTATGRPEVVR